VGAVIVVILRITRASDGIDAEDVVHIAVAIVIITIG
jgi:hypothetical protein